MANEIRTIDEFPDELILKVLSWLPSKDVISTSVLSKRWRSLWKEVKTFRYGAAESSRRNYWSFALLISRSSSVESLQLKLEPHYEYSDIKPLVNIAAARFLRELKVETVYRSFELPKSLYTISRIESLVLEKLSLVDVKAVNARFTCLKSLHLLSVKFSGDHSVERLLSMCVRLEDLVVRRSSYTNVKIFTIDVPTLKRLYIDNSSGKSRPKGVHGFVINAPSLRWFSIRDGFSNYLRFENMPELLKASVNVVCDQPDEFLGSLAATQCLSLCSITSQTPYPPIGTSFLFLGHLELCSCSPEWWNLLTLILNDAPRLRVLKLKLFQKHSVKYNDDNTMKNPWNRPNSVPECLSSHLEILEWRQYKGTTQEREAAGYILANASSLKKATFYTGSAAEKHVMLKDLECVARGSETCELVFE